MKRSIIAFASMGMLLMASCSSDELMQENNGTDGTVSFTVTLPDGIDSRAFSEAEAAKTLTYAVYEADSKEVVFSGTESGGREFSVNFNLVRGKSYDFVFWADKGDNTLYKYDETTQTITIDYSKMAVNDDTADAFFNVVKGFEVTGAMTKEVQLRRPFAQINVGTSDLAAVTTAGSTISGTEITVDGAYTELNLITGIADKAEKVTIAAGELPEGETFPYQSDTYDYLGMVYVLTGTELEADDVQHTQSELFDVDIAINYTTEGTTNIHVENAPVQRNYRTNIFGALLTSPLNFSIIIEPDYFIPGSNVEYDEDGFRVTSSLDEALTLLAKGEAAVAVEGEWLSAGAPSQVISRSNGAVVEFFLNKSVKHQRIKINGEATADIHVGYAELGEGETEAESNQFTLIVTSSAKGVELDLDGAEVAVEGKVDESGNKATIEALTITNAAAATVNGSVEIEDIATGDDFEGDVDFTGDVTLWITTADEFVEALGSEGVTVMNVKNDLDLSEYTIQQLTSVGAKEVYLADDITIQTGNLNYLNINDDFTLIGNATITNEFEETPDRLSGGKQIIVINKGTLTIENVTLINDRNYHHHGDTMNASAISYYPESNVTLKGVTVHSGEFVICCYNRKLAYDPIVNMTDCYLTSNSSTDNETGSYSYACRISGKKAVINNCTISGIQGALSIDYCAEAIINGGDYFTHYLDEEKKTGNCYGALYVTGESLVTILDGKFYSPNTTACVRSGDNDVNFPTGSITVKGGKYNYKPWNHVTKEVYEPVEGYIYEANTGADKDRYPWVVVKD